MALSIFTELSFINIINSRTFSSRPEEILYALPMSLWIPIVLSPSTVVVAHQSTFCLLHLSILDFSYKWKHTMGGLSAWLFSLSVVFSVWSIYQYFFPFYGHVIQSTVCMYHILFVHSSVNGHLGCSYLLTIMNNAAINTHVQVLCRHVFTFLGYIPKSGTVG